jgi:hypothetical protein
VELLLVELVMLEELLAKLQVLVEVMLEQVGLHNLEEELKELMVLVVHLALVVPLVMVHYQNILSPMREYLQF